MRRTIRPRAWLDRLASDVSDAEREDTFRWHDLEFLAPDLLQQNARVPFKSETLRNLDGRPQLVLAAGNLRIGRSKNHVSGKGISPKHVVKRLLELLGLHFPGDECSLRQVSRQERLADPSNRSCAASIALIRSKTTSSSIPDSLAISLNGSRTNPWIWSSDTARIFELTESVCSVAVIYGAAYGPVSEIASILLRSK